MLYGSVAVAMIFVVLSLFQKPTASLHYPYLAAEINGMAKEDEAASQFFLSGPTQDKEKRAAELKKLAEIDHRIAERMKWIVAKFGWPTPAMVGREASFNAWLLVQHATGDLPFQKLCLGLIEPLARSKVIPGDNYAYLYDRVQVEDGKLQRFGTQGKNDEVFLWINSVENPDKLDEYRKQYGLGPLDDYAKLLADSYRYKLAPDWRERLKPKKKKDVQKLAGNSRAS